mgnify:CR=1 FL=1
MKVWFCLAAIPLAGQPIWMVPDEFQVSPGQRVSVTFRSAAGRTPGPEQLRSAALYAPQAAYNVVNLRRDGEAVLGEATAKPEGTLALGVCAGPERRDCAKALLVSREPGGNVATRPLGLRFEIVPEKDPHKLRKGACLPVRVLFEGRPVVGAVLDSGSRSGPEGQASVAIGEDVPFRMSASQDGFTTTLVFAPAAAKD